MDAWKVLCDLTEAQGVTGDERAVSRVVERYFREYTDDVTHDVMGCVTAHLGKTGPRLIVCCHMDEGGLMVTRIEENGMLRLRAIGGVDARILPAMEVDVHGREKIPAVIGATPPHLLPGGTGKAYTVEEVVCDTGLAPERVKKLVSVGDYVTYREQPPLRLLNGRLSGKTFDDRSLILAELMAMEKLRGKELRCRPAFTATTQEEIGEWGSVIATRVNEADLSFVMDVTHAPSPGTKPTRVTPMDTVSICVGNNIHPKLYAWLVRIAEEEGIRYVPDACVGKTGTDAWQSQIQNGGIPTCLVSLPLRYMHTSVETIDLGTLENCAAILARFILELDESWEEKLCLDD